MVRRFIILLLELAGLLLVLGAAGLLWLSHYVDTDVFRDQFTQYAEQVIGRRIILEGEFNVLLAPHLSLEVLDLRMEDDPSFSDVSMARFDALAISFELIPLLSKRVDVRSISVEGMEVSLVYREDGVLNWDPVIARLTHLASDTGASSESAFEPGDFELKSLDIRNAHVTVQDKRDGQNVVLRGIDLRTGHVRLGDPVPFTLSTNISINNGDFLTAIECRGIVQTDLDGSNPVLRDGTVSATLDGRFIPEGEAPGKLAASLGLDWKRKQVFLDDLYLEFLGIRAHGHAASGDLDTALSATGKLVVDTFIPADVARKFIPSERVEQVKGLHSASLTSQFSIDENGAQLADLEARLDELVVHGTASVMDYTDPRLEFDLQGGLVDLDRYLPMFRTGTPFVWEDFALPFFGSLRGKGRARVAGFKVLDETLENLDASATADDQGIAVQAAGHWKREGPISGNARFVIQKTAAGVPTLAIKTAITSRSGDEGFTFLDVPPLDIRGAGILDISFDTGVMTCPDTGRSMEILRAATLDASLSLEKGDLLYFKDKKIVFNKDFKKFKGALNIRPAKKWMPAAYPLELSLDARTLGGERIRTIAVVTRGVVSVDAEQGRLVSDGLASKVAVAGGIYSDISNRLNITGNVAFDTRAKRLAVRDGALRTLDTRCSWDTIMTGLGDQFRAEGKLSVPSANVRRIVYLLTKIGLETKDPVALKDVRLNARYTVDDNGFSVTDIDARLDGMPIRGNVSGEGLANPMLGFSLTAGDFDLDRYLYPGKKPSLEALRAGYEHQPSPTALPMRFFEMLRLDGRARFESFKLARIVTRSLSGTISADNGSIRIPDIKGWVYGGGMTGALSGDVDKGNLALALKLQVDAMQAAQFMTDVAGRDYVRGLTDMDFDLTAKGKTDEDLLATLTGSASLETMKGSFKFTGYTSRPVSVKTNKKSRAKDDPTLRRTAFDHSKAVFDVQNGVMNLKEYFLDSTLLESHGSGFINLPKRTIDLLFRNDFAAVPSVPLRIVGNLADPKVEVPKVRMLNDTVRNILSLPSKSFDFVRDLF